MLTINDRYYIDTDMDYGYSNSWLGHKKYYYALYEKEGNITKRIREYIDLNAICDSLLIKHNKGLLLATSYSDIKSFINNLIKDNKIRKRELLP